MNQLLKHEDILDTLWGVDIAKFPAHLATINLAINDLAVDKNYPNIIQEDFFNLLTKPDGSWLPEKWRKARAKTLGKEERELQYPRYFNCVVGNPPYTRQEEIGEISPENLAYKESLIRKALFEENKPLAEISKRAGIYTYFFVHGTKFLRNSGRFGFIVSNAWLDVDYGKGLQEFFLKNYKITSIIESKVERWFEEADINTCIVVLEKCSGKEKQEERAENLVRFVYLKKPLRYFVPPAQDIWDKQIKRLQSIDNLIKTILVHDDFYENEDLRIFPKRQKDLWDEGFDSEENKYTGSKWGKYLRAPEIFFKILEKEEGKLVPLREIAEIRRGFTTGANEFFYLTQERIKNWKIEEKFLKQMVFSLKEIDSILVDPKKLKYKLFYCNLSKDNLKRLNYKNILRYINFGEKKNYHTRPTLKGRDYWYSIGEQKMPDFISNRFIGERFLFAQCEDMFVSDVFFIGYFKKKFKKSLGIALLNSTLSYLITEIMGRKTYGIGVMYIYGPEISNLLIVNPKVISQRQTKEIEQCLVTMGRRKMEDIYRELGVSSNSEISLEKVKPDRRRLDEIVMGEILGLTDEEQLEVYRAVIDLVKSRIEKAKSFGKRKITKNGLDIDALMNTILEKIGENTLKKFYKEKILSQKKIYTKKLPQLSETPRIEKNLFGWRLASGRNEIECHSEPESRYLKVWLEAGVKSIKVPKDEKYLEKITEELEELKTNLDKILETYLSSILNIKVRHQILHQILQKII